jgi:hypothetical protein
LNAFRKKKETKADGIHDNLLSSLKWPALDGGYEIN